MSFPVAARFSISAYFGDLDETHRGDENDPRVVVIEVVLNEFAIGLLRVVASFEASKKSSKPYGERFPFLVNCEQSPQRRLVYR